MDQTVNKQRTQQPEGLKEEDGHAQVDHTDDDDMAATQVVDHRDGGQAKVNNTDTEEGTAVSGTKEGKGVSEPIGQIQPA